MEIEYGYDRHCRSWCIIVHDDSGFEADCDYLGTKEGCMKRIEQMKAEYHTDNVRKIRPY